MNFSLIILRIVFVIIIALPNYLFYKKLRNIKKRHFKYQLIFFFVSLIISFLVLLSLAILKEIISDLLNIRIKENITYMVFFTIVLLPMSVLANMFFLNFYLRKINKINEIELIGKE
ncbi:hypothetical protein AAEO57_11210 [Flavobacterium sp. DGU38]|uniref:Uncharacterized protein n=1 Tax=Flavobacterium calami TaxID=3139144 RepID=A0ABU9IRR1_9FLAO